MTQTAIAPVQRFVFHGVSWDYYDRTLRELEASGSHARVTFDNGEMEIITPGHRHHRVKTAVARLLEMYSVEMDIPITGLGGVTFRREDLRKGLDPDECYYVVTAPPPMGDEGDPLNLATYPPPDLAIEIDITQHSIPKQPIYAAIGVPELWRYDGRTVTPMRLSEAGRYQAVDRSGLFPQLPMEQFNAFVTLALTQSQHVAAKAIQGWVRSGASR